MRLAWSSVSRSVPQAGVVMLFRSITALSRSFRQIHKVLLSSGCVSDRSFLRLRSAHAQYYTACTRCMFWDWSLYPAGSLFLGFYLGLLRRWLVAAVDLNIGVVRGASPFPVIPNLFADKGIRIFPPDIASGTDLIPSGKYFFHFHDRLLSSWAIHSNNKCLYSIDIS